MDEDNDEMIMVEADYEIIRKLTNKVDLLDINLNKLINNNNVFIENMLKINNLENLNIHDRSNIINDKDDKDRTVENKNIQEKNEFSEKKIKQIKKLCKKCKKQIFKKYEFCYKHCQEENIIPQNIKRKNYDDYIKTLNK